MVTDRDSHFLLTVDGSLEGDASKQMLVASLGMYPSSKATASEEVTPPVPFQAPGSVEEIRQAAARVYQVLDRARHHGGGTAGDLRDLQAAGQALSAALFPTEIAERLSTAASLTLSLSRKTLWIPWELAWIGGEHLGLQMPVGRFISELPLQEETAPRKRSGVRIVLVANPQFNLKEADREADELRQRFARFPGLPAPHIAAHEVTRQQFRQALSHGDWLHYAGHAEAGHAESPADAPARLLLADGPLEPGDVAVLLADSPPTFVMANACESARLSEAQSRDPGLAEAFLAAGARHYVGTLAPVLDAQGLRFVTRFYEDLLGWAAEGAAVGAALLAARRATVEAAGKASLIWACYVLYGDPLARLIEASADDLSADGPSADGPTVDDPASSASDDLWRQREARQARADLQEHQAHLGHEAEVKDILRQEELRDYQSAAEARQWDRKAQESAKEQAYQTKRSELDQAALEAQLEQARLRLDHELEEAARWGQLGLQLEAQQDRQRLELESRRLEALSSASLEALMVAAADNQRAVILGELAKTRALAGRTLAEVLALTDERSSLVAEAIRERLQAESHPRRIELQQRLGDQILDAQVESASPSALPEASSEQLYRLLGDAVLPDDQSAAAPSTADPPRHCPQCQASLPAEALFCNHCGQRLA